jgi:hypothetical protein
LKSSASKIWRSSISAPPSNGALEPLDGFLARVALPDPVARDELLALGERAVDDGRPAVLEPHQGALG